MFSKIVMVFPQKRTQTPHPAMVFQATKIKQALPATKRSLKQATRLTKKMTIRKRVL